MLTRLKVDGFKNLTDVDVRFGPFTCIAGPNGIGKSNLFDAIMFLSALADKTLAAAASSVRGNESGRGDLRSLFTRNEATFCDRMSFVAEMLIPRSGTDSLGQQAHAGTTYLRYTLELRYVADEAGLAQSRLEIVQEDMVRLTKTEANKTLSFPRSKDWLSSVVRGSRDSPYIRTSQREDGTKIIELHADNSSGRGGGRDRKVPASGLPRTMLSSVTDATEHRTLILARQEMMGWMQLQLDPYSLRKPDSFNTPTTIAQDGAHMPGTLLRLTREAAAASEDQASDLLARLSNRLAELNEDVRQIRVDVDPGRQQLNVVVTDRWDTEHLAASLSDGTLRFLALSVLAEDTRGPRLLCLEEPENGIHPLRVARMIALIQALAVNTEVAVDDDNPLRQVIINTHSPAVVSHVSEDALLIALPTPRPKPGERGGIRFAHLTNTWRARMDPHARTVSLGELAEYLNPLAPTREPEPEVNDIRPARPRPTRNRVMDRPDLQLILPLAADSAR